MQDRKFDMSDESSDESQKKNKHRMPPDFDINANIPTLREQFIQENTTCYVFSPSNSASGRAKGNKRWTYVLFLLLLLYQYPSIPLFL